MSPPPRFLTLEEVVALHDRIVELSGGSWSPLLHSGLLESALSRPKALNWYEGADIARQAVGLAVGISQAQAFMDGNKRAALAAFDAFLMINGRQFDGDQMERALWLERVAKESGNRDAVENDFSDWLRERLIPFEDVE